MDINSSETTILANNFGTVTNKRVIYFANKTWFRGGVREDVPVQHIVSVRSGTDRNLWLGLFLCSFGLLTLSFVIGIFILWFGVMALWGSPIVNIVTAGGTHTSVQGLPWQRQQAEDFANALRGLLFNETDIPVINFE